MFPKICRRFRWGDAYLELLRNCRKVKGVKKVFVASGLRYDLLLERPDILEEILIHHSGAFLRIAPEHTEDHVLELMGKPPFETLESFVKLFRSITASIKRKIELALYLIVGHPGETSKDVLLMKEKLKALRLTKKDVQIFTPTPGTLSTAMYYAGMDALKRPLPVESNLKALALRRREVSDA